MATRKFQLMQYKKATGGYEKVASVVGDDPRCCEQLPDKLTYKFVEVSRMPHLSSLHAFELRAENDHARRQLPKLGEYLTSNRRAGHMPVPGVGDFYLMGVEAPGGAIALRCGMSWQNAGGGEGGSAHGATARPASARSAPSQLLVAPSSQAAPPTAIGSPASLSMARFEGQPAVVAGVADEADVFDGIVEVITEAACVPLSRPAALPATALPATALPATAPPATAPPATAPSERPARKPEVPVAGSSASVGSRLQALASSGADAPSAPASSAAAAGSTPAPAAVLRPEDSDGSHHVGYFVVENREGRTVARAKLGAAREWPIGRADSCAIVIRNSALEVRLPDFVTVAAPIPAPPEDPSPPASRPPSVLAVHTSPPSPMHVHSWSRLRMARSLRIPSRASTRS